MNCHLLTGVFVQGDRGVNSKFGSNLGTTSSGIVLTKSVIFEDCSLHRSCNKEMLGYSLVMPELAVLLKVHGRPLSILGSCCMKLG